MIVLLILGMILTLAALVWAFEKEEENWKRKNRK